MANPWFRVYSDIRTDPKLTLIAFEDQRHYIWILSLKSDGTLDQFDGNNRTRIVAAQLGLDIATAEEVRRRLMEVFLIDGNWQPVAWDKRQYVSDTSAERMRKYRERQKKKESDVTVTSQKRRSDATVTPLDTDTDTDTDNPPLPPKGEPLPGWLRKEDWQAFKEHRRRLRKPMTPRAEILAINELSKLVAKGHSATDLINHAILKGWQSIYEPKGNGSAATKWEGID